MGSAVLPGLWPIFLFVLSLYLYLYLYSRRRASLSPVRPLCMGDHELVGTDIQGSTGWILEHAQLS